jgi:hypothetical protein
MTRQAPLGSTWIRIVAVLVLATVALITTVAAGPLASHALPSKGQTDLPLSDAFALLREPANAPAPATLIAALAHVPPSFGLDVSAARRSAGTGAWLIPGAGGLCLGVRDNEGLGISCSSAASAERGELAFEELSSVGGDGTVIGVAPDWIPRMQVRAGLAGAAAAAPATENTYAVSGLRTGQVVRASEGALQTETGG